MPQPRKPSQPGAKPGTPARPAPPSSRAKPSQSAGPGPQRRPARAAGPAPPPRPPRQARPANPDAKPHPKPNSRPGAETWAPVASVQPLVPAAEFLTQAEELGILFEDGDLHRLGLFLALMLEANKTTNLTAITEPGEAWRKHILDALAMVQVIESFRSDTPSDAPSADLGFGIADRGENPKSEIPNPKSISLIDIGSGGGVPALPLAIVLPDVKFTLVESTGKKADFLRHVARELKLKNMHVLQTRAETLGQDHKGHREKYDIATARALGHLAVVAELCGPLVKQHGVVIAVKGGKADQELEEAKKALGEIGLRHAQTLDTPTGKLVVLEKTIKTPRLYPRRDGEPSRVPLGMKKA